MRLVRAALLLAVTGCAAAPGRERPAGPALPALPAEPLRITVVYPDTAIPIQAHDSSFLFGSVGRGRGDATLSVDGRPVPVLPSGAWLAWVPLPDDSVAVFRLVARTAADSQVTLFTARIAPRFSRACASPPSTRAPASPSLRTPWSRPSARDACRAISSAGP